ncbi:MAG TPA: CRISPR-associated protein Cas5 [Candidatus Scatomorpha intestinavium]|uniref:CRISPR-associated protein Cas5 n=1 Tax=Candidatus Scatomorpha intestinavium TaxID=2840922 RepID=A0A9D0ZE59_9FIRM|nr:CRISPR-associated protein Cas5 [Candidatus Scatomorpha intestinavium]
MKHTLFNIKTPRRARLSGTFQHFRSPITTTAKKLSYPFYPQEAQT